LNVAGVLRRVVSLGDLEEGKINAVLYYPGS
jgi:hypothetical protein